MKKNVLFVASLMIAAAANAQMPSSLKEDYSTTPCHAAWLVPGSVQGSPGHDLTAASYGNGELTFTSTDNTGGSGPFYYKLTNDVVTNCGTEAGTGQVDISGHPHLRIKAKASANTTCQVYLQEGSTESWDYSKFSSSVLKLNLTTSYQVFDLTSIAATSITPGQPNIDLTKIGIVAFEMKDGATDIHFAGTITVDFIALGNFDVNVNEVSNVSNFTVFPSPATSEVNLKFTAQEAATVTLTDITGRVMVSEQVAAGSVSKSYDVSNFAQGLYFVTVSSASGQTTEKFMVK